MQKRFEDARRLQQEAAVAFMHEMLVSQQHDALWDLDERIDLAEKDFLITSLAQNTPPPAYWSASPHLNLTREQVEAVESWVGRPLKAENALYLASQHGFDSREFHHKCDKKGATITLVRTRTGHIFGGYASVSWGRGALKTKPPRWDPIFVADSKVRP